VASLTAEVDTLTKTNADLRQKLDAANASRSGVSNQIKAQDATHVEEHGAVLQAQAETTDTLATATNSLNRQIEFERQLSALQKDLHKVVGLQTNAMYMLIAMFVLVASFTGVIVYSTRRRRDDARTE
jgi:uncharacterized iron-regulated membrane protein